MPSRSIDGFLPSTSGFHFANAFPHVPVRRIGIPGVIEVPIGDASNGLCGGMVFAARDYFEAGRPPPPATESPSSGSLFDYLVRRLFDSFNLPTGPLEYLKLMNPRLPDGETMLTRLGLLPHGRAWRTIRTEWPAIRAGIDAGHPVPLGLVRAKSENPFDLKFNHQVLAYGYEVTGEVATLLIYDPNLPDRDDVSLSFPLGDPTRPVRIEASPAGPPVYALFTVRYTAVPPP
jgi:hypothetical protein